MSSFDWVWFVCGLALAALVARAISAAKRR
jgi:hypothetical protein